MHLCVNPYYAKSRYIGFFTRTVECQEICVFSNVTMTTPSMTERRRRPIVFNEAFEGKTLVVFALICNAILCKYLFFKMCKRRHAPENNAQYVEHYSLTEEE